MERLGNLIIAAPKPFDRKTFDRKTFDRKANQLQALLFTLPTSHAPHVASVAKDGAARNGARDDQTVFGQTVFGQMTGRRLLTIAETIPLQE
uniref:Transposase n=1 Tax=Steinernema glaseri TaxID=37863 RepID=A0A1I8APE0_9BILA